MTARAGMAAAGSRILDLLTLSEAAALLAKALGIRVSVKTVCRLADAGELERLRFGSRVRITPESVAAYIRRMAGETNLGDPR